MSRPNENRVRRVIHVLPATDATLQTLAVKHGTFGRAIDAALGTRNPKAGRAAGAGVRANRADSKRKKYNGETSDSSGGRA